MKKIGKSKIFFTLTLLLVLSISLLIPFKKGKLQKIKSKKIPFQLERIHIFYKKAFLPILNKIEDITPQENNLLLSSNCGILKVKNGNLCLMEKFPLPPSKKILSLSNNSFLILSNGVLYLLEKKKLKKFHPAKKLFFIDMIKKNQIIYLLTQKGKLIKYERGNFYQEFDLKKNLKGFEIEGDNFYIYGEKYLFLINKRIGFRKRIKIDEGIKNIFTTDNYLLILTGKRVLLFSKKLKYIRDLFFNRVIVDIFSNERFLFFYSSLEGFIRVKKTDILNKRFKIKLFPLPFSSVKIKGNYLISDNKIYEIETSEENIFIKNVVFNNNLLISSYIKKIIFAGEKIVMLTFRDGILIFDRNLNLLKRIFEGELNFLNSISTYKDKIIAGGDFGIFIINPKNNFSYKISEEFKNIGGCINCILEEKDKLFFGTSKGIYIYENGVLKGIFIVNNLPSNKVYTMLKWGNHLVCGGDAGFFFLNKDNYKMERSINSLNSNLDSDWIPSLTHLMGKILVGTYGGSIYTYDATCGKLKMLKKGKYFLTENCTAKVNDKITLLGTLNGNIFLIKNKSLEITEIPWIYGSIYSISKNKKEIFISSEGGILKIGEKELIKYLQKEKSKYN